VSCRASCGPTPGEWGDAVARRHCSFRCRSGRLLSSAETPGLDEQREYAGGRSGPAPLLLTSKRSSARTGDGAVSPFASGSELRVRDRETAESCPQWASTALLAGALYESGPLLVCASDDLDAVAHVNLGGYVCHSVLSLADDQPLRDLPRSIFRARAAGARRVRARWIPGATPRVGGRGPAGRANCSISRHESPSSASPAATTNTGAREVLRKDVNARRRAGVER
jgi:hypothetical protein